MTEIKRSVYTFWNVLGDVGGLGGLILGLSEILTRYMSFQYSESFIAHKLYQRKEEGIKTTNVGGHQVNLIGKSLTN